MHPGLYWWSWLLGSKDPFRPHGRSGATLRFHSSFLSLPFSPSFPSWACSTIASFLSCSSSPFDRPSSPCHPLSFLTFPPSPCALGFLLSSSAYSFLLRSDQQLVPKIRPGTLVAWQAMLFNRHILFFFSTLTLIAVQVVVALLARVRSPTW